MLSSAMNDAEWQILWENIEAIYAEAFFAGLDSAIEVEQLRIQAKAMAELRGHIEAARR